MPTTCHRCGGEIEEPAENHAAYVIGSDTTETESVEVSEAVVHTQATKDALASLQKRHYPERPIEELERAVVSDTPFENYLGTPAADEANAPDVRMANAKAKAPALADFDRVEVTDVSEAPSETVKVERVVKQKERQKTGLVHLDCKQSDDEVIWEAEA